MRAPWPPPQPLGAPHGTTRPSSPRPVSCATRFPAIVSHGVPQQEPIHVVPETPARARRSAVPDRPFRIRPRLDRAATAAAARRDRKNPQRSAGRGDRTHRARHRGRMVPELGALDGRGELPLSAARRDGVQRLLAVARRSRAQGGAVGRRAGAVDLRGDRAAQARPGQLKITLRYTQVLDRIGDALRFRYAAGTPAASRSFRLQVDSAARVGDPYSPTHRLTVNHSGDRLDLALADTTAAGDLELLLPLARGLVGVSLLTQQSAGEDGSFMLLLAPGRAAEVGEPLRRDVVAVLDVSGSMSGDKLDQAKAALVQLLGGLRSSDRFRVVTFGSGVRRYTAGWTDASGDNVRAAQDWIRRLDTGGGTNIAGALTEGLAEQPRDGALGVVVFLTDGLPTVGETDPERLADQAERSRGPFRVFAFGIGYDVNTYLLDRLTDRARGVTEYIRPGGNIEQTVGALAAKISSPVLTDLALRGDGIEFYDLQPERLPDLFAGDELVLFGRYRGVRETGDPKGRPDGRGRR